MIDIIAVDSIDRLEDDVDFVEYFKSGQGLEHILFNLTDEDLERPELKEAIKKVFSIIPGAQSMEKKLGTRTLLKGIIKKFPEDPRIINFIKVAAEIDLSYINEKIDNVSELKRVISSDKNPEEFINWLANEATALGIYWSFGDGFAYDADKSHPYRYTFVTNVSKDEVDVKRTQLASLKFHRNEQEIRLKQGTAIKLTQVLYDGSPLQLPPEVLEKTFYTSESDIEGSKMLHIEKVSNFLKEAGKKELIQEIQGKKKFTSEQAQEVYKQISGVSPENSANKNYYKYVDFLVHQYLNNNYNPYDESDNAKAVGGAQLFLDSIQKGSLNNEGIKNLSFQNFHSVLQNDPRVELKIQDRVKDTDAKFIDASKDEEGNTYHLFEVPTSKGVEKLFNGSTWCIRNSSTADSYLKNGQKIDNEEHPFFFVTKNGEPFLLHHNLDFREKHDMIPTNDQEVLFDRIIEKADLPTEYKISNQLPLNKEEVNNLQVNDTSNSYKMAYIANEYSKAGKELPEGFFDNWNGNAAYFLVKYFLKTNGEVPDFVWDRWDSFNRDYEVGSIISTYIQSGKAKEIPEQLLNREAYYSDSITAFLQSGLEVPENIWENWTKNSMDDGSDVISWYYKHKDKEAYKNIANEELFEKIKFGFKGSDFYKALLVANSKDHFLSSEEVEGALNKALESSDSAHTLLRDKIITKDDGDLYSKVLDKVLEGSSYAYNLLRNQVITKDNGEVYTKVLDKALERSDNAYYLLENNIITKEDGEVYTKVLDKALEDSAYVYGLLRYKVITKDDGEVYIKVLNKALEDSRYDYYLLRDKIITKNDGELYTEVLDKVLDKAVEDSRYVYNLLIDKIITKNDGDLYTKALDKVLDKALENSYGAYSLLEDKIITKDNGEVYTKVLDKVLENSYGAYSLLENNIITKDNGEVYTKVLDKALEDSGYKINLLEKGIITPEELDEYNNQEQQNQEEQPEVEEQQDNINKTQFLHITTLNKLASSEDLELSRGEIGVSLEDYDPSKDKEKSTKNRWREKPNQNTAVKPALTQESDNYKKDKLDKAKYTNFLGRTDQDKPVRVMDFATPGQYVGLDDYFTKHTDTLQDDQQQYDTRNFGRGKMQPKQYSNFLYKSELLHITTLNKIAAESQDSSGTTSITPTVTDKVTESVTQKPVTPVTQGKGGKPIKGSKAGGTGTRPVKAFYLTNLNSIDIIADQFGDGVTRTELPESSVRRFRQEEANDRNKKEQDIARKKMKGKQNKPLHNVPKKDVYAWGNDDLMGGAVFYSDMSIPQMGDLSEME